MTSLTGTDPMHVTGPASTARAQFETDYARGRRQARATWLAGSAIFLVLFVLTAWLGDFFKMTPVTLADGSREWRWIIPAGLPRLGEYLSKAMSG